MIEKTRDLQAIKFQKKIISYIDGSLSADDKSEFEAYVRTHPEFETKIKEKENELTLIKDLMPATTLSAESQKSLEDEMRVSIFNLLKQEPKTFMDKMKNSWEEWINR